MKNQLQVEFWHHKQKKKLISEVKNVITLHNCSKIYYFYKNLVFLQRQLSIMLTSNCMEAHQFLKHSLFSQHQAVQFCSVPTIISSDLSWSKFSSTSCLSERRGSQSITPAVGVPSPPIMLSYLFVVLIMLSAKRVNLQLHAERCHFYKLHPPSSVTGSCHSFN